MKDLKIYYETDDGCPAIDSDVDSLLELIAKLFNLEFYGSGVEIGKGIRDIHYGKKK